MPSAHPNRSRQQHFLLGRLRLGRLVPAYVRLAARHRRGLDARPLAGRRRQHAEQPLVRPRQEAAAHRARAALAAAVATRRLRLVAERRTAGGVTARAARHTQALHGARVAPVHRGGRIDPAGRRAGAGVAAAGAGLALAQRLGVVAARVRLVVGAVHTGVGDPPGGMRLLVGFGFLRIGGRRGDGDTAEETIY